MTWRAPPRASWVERLAAVGRGLGDDGRSIVSLEPENIVAAARAATGLDDIGDAWFREPLFRLCAALEGEGRLHLAGRLRARSELQLLMENRIRLVDLWAGAPDIAGASVTAPIVVTGLGRSGTTLLHELLACDPDNRAPMLWELLHTVPPSSGRWPEEERAVVAVLADAEVRVMDEMVPAFTTMHDNGGGLPAECIFAFAHQFSTDMFTGLYNVPSYTVWRSGVDQAPIYEWHRRILQTLQWQRETVRWVLKAPSHLSSLDLVFATYPDARVVITHRDPLRVIGSLADLMATLQWMHSDHVEYDALVAFMCLGLELLMDSVTAQRDSGALPPDRISDVRYHDLVRDPVGTVESLYRTWGLDVTPVFRSRLEAYQAGRHRDRGPVHDYRFEDTGLDLVEHRALLASYQERFGVASEV